MFRELPERGPSSFVVTIFLDEIPVRFQCIGQMNGKYTRWMLDLAQPLDELPPRIAAAFADRMPSQRLSPVLAGVGRALTEAIGQEVPNYRVSEVSVDRIDVDETRWNNVNRP